MKRIGFVDYYLSEWHANNYPAWIAQAGKALGLEYEVAYAWAEQEISPVDGVSTQQWCDKMCVRRCESIEELCQKSDVIVVLAPSDPQKHLGYAQKVLPFGKRTYIDKTFAPDVETAQEIFHIAERYGTPFFSTSALRCAEELKALVGADALVLRGGGRSFEEYIIHLAEMAVVLLNDPVRRVRVEQQDACCLCHVQTQGGKSAQLVFGEALSYEAEGTLADGARVTLPIQSDFFGKLIADILTFFERGELPFEPAQTLEVMRMRDALLRARSAPGEWVEA